MVIEAPTGQEGRRAEKMCDRFKALGLEDVHIDQYGNAVGIRKGSDSESYILIEAHMDTVFPKGTVIEMPKLDGNIIRCPGIHDNTAGLANLLAVIRALDAANIKTKYSLMFAGTVGEEGLGCLRGMKGIISDL